MKVRITVVNTSSPCFENMMPGVTLFLKISKAPFGFEEPNRFVFQRIESLFSLALMDILLLVYLLLRKNECGSLCSVLHVESLVTLLRTRSVQCIPFMLRTAERRNLPVLLKQNQNQQFMRSLRRGHVQYTPRIGLKHTSELYLFLCLGWNLCERTDTSVNIHACHFDWGKTASR